MNYKHTDIRFLILLVFLLVTACERPIYDENYDESTQTESPLIVSARSSEGLPISYPAYIYAFTEDGSCAASQVMESNDDQIELKLSPETYTIVAIAGIGENVYSIPENPTIDSIITMKENNQSNRALMIGRSPITVKNGKEASISITLNYAVSAVDVTLKDIPSQVEKVTLEISPLYSSISFRGEYSGKDESTKVSCEKETDGTWSAGPFYVFPGSSSQTAFSITLEEDGQTKTYGYTFTGGKPEANVPFHIGGSYLGDVTIDGSLIPGDWKDPLDVSFDFGPSSDNKEDEDPSTDPDLSGIPEIGSIWKDGIVASIDNTDSNGADILLMSLSEWSSLTSNVQETIAEALTDGWHLPIEAEAKSLYTAFVSIVDKVNTTIENLGYGDPLINTNKRYLYDSNETFYTFAFKASSKFTAAGTKTEYNIRLVRTVHYEAGN